MADCIAAISTPMASGGVSDSRDEDEEEEQTDEKPSSLLSLSSPLS